MFWVYIYLTDVGPKNGPHKLIRSSGDFAVVRERFERAKADPALAKRTFTTLADVRAALKDQRPPATR